MPHAINAGRILLQMDDTWPKSTQEILEWARTHEEFPNQFLDDLRRSLPDRTWNSWDELENEVQNYTWTMPDNEGEEEDIVWGGGRRPEAGRLNP
jgi:hypothetical protein